MSIKVVVELTPKDIGALGKIGEKGLASSGYRQDFNFCLQKAIDEFILKYKGKEIPGDVVNCIVKNCERKASCNYQKIWTKFNIHNGIYIRDDYFDPLSIEEPTGDDNLHYCGYHAEMFEESGEVEAEYHSDNEVD